jgi:hypothetical protein
VIIFLFLFWIILGLIGGSIASGKGRSSIGWFFVCMFLPLLGFLLLLVLPNRRETGTRSQVIIQQAPQGTPQMFAAQGSVQLPLPDPDKQWAALVEYDPVIREAVAAVQPFGSEAVASLREAFMSLQDRSLVPAIVARLREKHQPVKSSTTQVPSVASNAQTASGKTRNSANGHAAGGAATSSITIPQHNTVNEAELSGAKYLETHCGHHLFQLRDGRIYVDRYAALPSIDQARRTIEGWAAAV